MKIFMKSSVSAPTACRRRTPLSLAEAYRFAENGKVPIKSRGLNRQVAGEIAYFLSVYRPVPRLYLSYERTAFFEKGGGDLRISFDSGILSRRDDLFPESGPYGLAAEGADAALIMCSIPRPGFRRAGPMSLA